MENTVFVKSLTPPPINEKEVMRYAGIKTADGAEKSLVEECILAAGNVFRYAVCFAEVPVKISADEVDLGFVKTRSRDLAKNLKNCEKAVVFAATAGLEIDRMIIKYSTLSPSKAVIFQALGAERIEALCDCFNKEITEKYGKTRPRFSAGYGDLEIKIQRDIFAFLGCSQKIGVVLNDSMLMTPSKSVTAIIGVEK
ncbi:MAG: Vitamin B12 dependent methionine synthase activation subunit [Clostridiales bacterium]|nr:Vitamin B12 dependent methionine synthase activation subunit [Candidatus Equinaster intestinalis]